MCGSAERTSEPYDALGTPRPTTAYYREEGRLLFNAHYMGDEFGCFAEAFTVTAIGERLFSFGLGA